MRVLSIGGIKDNEVSQIDLSKSSFENNFQPAIVEYADPSYIEVLDM